jgi:hypothetical protein
MRFTQVSLGAAQTRERVELLSLRITLTLTYLTAAPSLSATTNTVVNYGSVPAYEAKQWRKTFQQSKLRNRRQRTSIQGLREMSSRVADKHMPSLQCAKTSCTHRPDDGAGTDLWNVGKLIPVHGALQPTRQPSSSSKPPATNQFYCKCYRTGSETSLPATWLHNPEDQNKQETRCHTP